MDMFPSASRVLTIKKSLQADHAFSSFPESPQLPFVLTQLLPIFTKPASPQRNLSFKPLLYMHGVVWKGRYALETKMIFHVFASENQFYMYQTEHLTNCFLKNRVKIVLELSRKVSYT